MKLQLLKFRLDFLQFSKDHGMFHEIRVIFEFIIFKSNHSFLMKDSEMLTADYI